MVMAERCLPGGPGGGWLEHRTKVGRWGFAPSTALVISGGSLLSNTEPGHSRGLSVLCLILCRVDVTLRDTGAPFLP